MDLDNFKTRHLHRGKELISKVSHGAAVSRKHKSIQPAGVGLKIERGHRILKKLVPRKVKLVERQTAWLKTATTAGEKCIEIFDMLENVE
jgi:hypothetical protein